MYKCKQCEKEFEHFTTLGGHVRQFHKEIKNETFKANIDEDFKCLECGKIFKTSNSVKSHAWLSHTEKGKALKQKLSFKKGQDAWNKGLTKETDERVKQYGETISKINIGIQRPSLSPEHKENVSKGMLKAHQEGRAWNIGMNRWNNKPSYPEQFFMKVVENEFKDKNYIREYNVGIYSIDFAWIEKKIAIEIDGEQHNEPHYKLRDERKDKCLLENNWKVYRIKWKDLHNNPKETIKKIKDIIDI
jgi:very-short-patch-repair endonuclease/DNA-directed RNA polymerase subunit RPC12/RpoP